METSRCRSDITWKSALVGNVRHKHLRDMLQKRCVVAYYGVARINGDCDDWFEDSITVSAERNHLSL